MTFVTARTQSIGIKLVSTQLYTLAFVSLFHFPGFLRNGDENGCNFNKNAIRMNRGKRYVVNVGKKP